MVHLESNSSLRALSRQKLTFSYKFQNHPYVVPMNTNNSSGPKKLLSSDSRKPRPTILTVPIVRKLMTMLWDRSPFACLDCINRAWGMMGATCYKHLPSFTVYGTSKEEQSSLCLCLHSQNQNFQTRKTSYFFVWVTVSVTPLCVVIGLQSLLKGDAQMMAQVPADSADAASSFPLLTTAW